jgi:hypothetical protein
MAMEAFRETLAGLTGVNLQVEPLNADAEQDGLAAADLRVDVATALEAAGLRVFSLPELFADAPGRAFLHLDVMTIRLDGHYAYSVRLELWQAVRLVRDPSIQALGMTWTAPELIGTVATGSLTDIRRTVRSAVDEFVADLAAAAKR